MEWVETTGKSLEEATAKALDQLGVAEDEAEIDVLDEPKSGLFGRVRGEARVRARVKPTPVRNSRPERRDRRRKGGAAESGAEAEKPAPRPERASSGNSRSGEGQERSAGERTPRPERGPRPERAERSERPVSAVDAEQVGAEAQRFVEGLVAAFGVTAATELSGEGGELEIRVTGEDVGLLVGPRGATLQAVQDLARVASQRRLGDHDTRLRVDIGGYRERRQQALSAFAVKMADEVRESGTARVLEPMGSADRKVIHDALSGVDGVATRSEGDDPFRRVVIAPT